MGLGRRKPDSTLEAKEILSTVETESRKIDPRFADVRTSCTTVSTSELLRSPSPRMRSPSARPIPKYSPNVAGVPDGDEHTARAAENTPILLSLPGRDRRKGHACIRGDARVSYRRGPRFQRRARAAFGRCSYPRGRFFNPVPRRVT